MVGSPKWQNPKTTLHDPCTFTVDAVIHIFLSYSSSMITVCLVADSVLLLGGWQAELSGDPWVDFSNAQLDHDYWDWAYFTIVTMSTVGYGDIACKTVCGRFFIVIFIFGALVSGW